MKACTLVFAFGVVHSQQPSTCKNFAFVSIPEAGGRAARQSFAGVSSESKAFVNTLRHVCSVCGTTHNAIAASQMIEWGEMAWRSAYTLSVISNPFQWIASLFFFEKNVCLHTSNREYLEQQSSAPFYVCSLNESQQHPSSPFGNKNLFRMWLTHADSYAHSSGTRFLLPHPVAFTTQSSNLPMTQYSYVANTDGSGLGVDHFVKAEDTESMVQISNPGLLARVLCSNVPPSWDASNSSRIDIKHPLAVPSELYDDVTCEIVQRRLSLDFRKFNYSTVCPHAVQLSVS